MLFLIGYRGTGKTTVGQLLAQRLGWSFVDTDEFLQQRQGRSIADIFHSDGEAGFRELESQVIRDVAAGPVRTVVALGGGAVLREDNRQVVRRSGQCVWLVGSEARILERIQNDTATASQRPALTAGGPIAEIRQLLASRRPIYAGCADLEIDTDDCAADQVAARIAEWLQHQRPPSPEDPRKHCSEPPPS